MQVRLFVPTDFFFVNLNNVLYLYFASFKQVQLFKYTGFVEVIIESDRASKALAG